MSTPRPKKEAVLVLENIRSVHNVGAIFRTADAAGIRKIFLCGVTPAPLDRFGRMRSDMAKSAPGAERTVPWESVSGAAECLEKLKKEGFSIISLEQTNTSEDYKNVLPDFPLAVVLGNEVDGVSKEALALSHRVIHIPMQGKKESLNVSVAAGIALFRLLGI